MNSRATKKPEFGGIGGWVDPDFLPMKVKQELMLHLKKSTLTDAEKTSLIKFCNDMGQIIETETVAYAQQVKQIKAIESNARRLIASMTQMSQAAEEAFTAHALYLAYGTRPPIDLPKAVIAEVKRPGGNLLSSAWDWVQSLEQAASYAAEKYRIDRQSKPEQNKARGFVSLLATRIKELSGELPPKDRASWFAAFAACAGDHIGLHIGPRIIASGVDAAR